MGAIYHSDCPHCGKNNVQFTGSSAAPNKSVIGGLPRCSVFLTCNNCKNPISLIVEFHSQLPWLKDPDDFVIPELGKSTADYQIHTVSMFPIPEAPTAPSATPTPIARTFIEAMDNLKRGNFETCEMLCRKVLDIATKNLKPGIDKFYNRIEALREDGTITPAMSDWAHIVRMDGNRSNHSEEETTQQSAKELVDFTETFLVYAFTLPDMVNARRQNQAD